MFIGLFNQLYLKSSFLFLLFGYLLLMYLLCYFLEELADAFRNRTDVHFCMYFSLFEFFHPLFLYDQANNFTTRKYPEVRRL